MPRVFIMMIAGLGEVFSAYIFAQKKRKSKSGEDNAIDLWQKAIKSFCLKRKKKLFAYFSFSSRAGDKIGIEYEITK